MQPGHWWLVGGVGLLVVEVLAPGVFMMWLGLAALGTGALVYAADPSFGMQVLAFAVLAIVAIFVGVRLRPTRPQQSLNTKDSGLVGRTARVLVAGQHDLRVRVGDTDWSAHLAKGRPAPAVDAELIVLGVDGTTLVVG